MGFQGLLYNLTYFRVDRAMNNDRHYTSLVYMGMYVADKRHIVREFRVEN